MRSFVFLLVLANLLFFAWMQGYFGAPVSSDAGRLAQQISPEKLRIVARGEAPPAAAAGAEPATPALPPAAAANEACFTWNHLAAVDAEALMAAVAQKSPTTRLERQDGTAPASWWVFIPPLKTKADAERKSAELKAIGITEFFVVTEAGPNRWSISLGVFSTEEAANGALAALRDKGVRSARVGPKGAPMPVVTLTVRAALSEAAALRALSQLPAAACAPASGR
jgi:hypothetical protein